MGAFGSDDAKKYGGGSGGDRFKFQKGDNRMRILEIAEDMLATHFIDDKPVICIGVKEGCPYHGDNAPKGKDGKPQKPSIKKLMYVWSVADEAVKLVFMPYSVVRALDDLVDEDGWEFDGFPMPYLVNVKYDKDAAPNDMYKMIGSPKREDVDGVVLEQMNAMPKLSEVMDRLKTKPVEPDPNEPPF